MDEIQEGNNEIAKFCGNKFIKKHFFSDLMDVEYELMDLDDLKFHSDWNWLHLAWDRFRDLSFKGDVKNQVHHSNYRDRISKAISWGGTVRDAFDELVLGIKWYNNKIANSND